MGVNSNKCLNWGELTIICVYGLAWINSFNGLFEPKWSPPPHNYTKTIKISTVFEDLSGNSVFFEPKCEARVRGGGGLAVVKSVLYRVIQKGEIVPPPASLFNPSHPLTGTAAAAPNDDTQYCGQDSDGRQGNRRSYWVDLFNVWQHYVKIYLFTQHWLSTNTTSPDFFFIQNSSNLTLTKNNNKKTRNIITNSAPSPCSVASPARNDPGRYRTPAAGFRRANVLSSRVACLSATLLGRQLSKPDCLGVQQMLFVNVGLHFWSVFVSWIFHFFRSHTLGFLAINVIPPPHPLCFLFVWTFRLFGSWLVTLRQFYRNFLRFPSSSQFD